jgi:hypothetical protein
MANSTYENLIKNLCMDGKNQADAVLANSTITYNEVEIGLKHEEITHELGHFNCLTLEAIVADIPTAAEKRFFEEILEANFIWLSTGGATLWIAPGTKKIGLGIRMAIDQASSHELQLTLDGFTQAAKTLTKTFKESAAKLN